MSKIKFYYDTDTCKYTPIIATKKQVFWNAIGFIFVSILLASVIVYTYRKNFISSRELELKSRNSQLIIEWEILNEKLLVHSEQLNKLQFNDDNIYRIILNTDPIPLSVREGGIGGHDKFEEIKRMNYESSDFVYNIYKKIETIKKQLYIQSKSYDQVFEILKTKEKIWSSRPAIQPINNKELTRLYTTFGNRYHPILKIWKRHEGLDFTAPRGTPVYATGDGYIKSAYRSSSYGNVIFLEHGYGYQTRYAHLNKYIVEEKQQVKRGQIIGYVGNTGRSEASHLHYEVLYNYKPINPINFFQIDLDNEEYEKLIEISKKNNIPLD